MTLACKELNVMPQTGGFFDQDAFHIYGMGIVLDELRAKEAHDRHQEELKAKHGRR